MSTGVLITLIICGTFLTVFVLATIAGHRLEQNKRKAAERMVQMLFTGASISDADIARFMDQESKKRGGSN